MTATPDPSSDTSADRGTKSLWELLWDYDPNGLVAVDEGHIIRVVNPAFCGMFGKSPDELIGRPVGEVMDVADFARVWSQPEPFHSDVVEYPKLRRFVKKLMFAIPAQKLAACVLVDMTREEQQRRELLRIREEALRNVSLVVDKHMQVAQEIAGLLGETTAETKINLLKLAAMLKQEGE